MKRGVLLLLAVLSLCGLQAQTPTVNLDESLVPEYVLPDPLTCRSGELIADTAA